MSHRAPLEVVGYPQAAGVVTHVASRPGEPLGDKLARLLSEPVKMVRPAPRDVRADKAEPPPGGG
jgi:hypothetical protein